MTRLRVGTLAITVLCACILSRASLAQSKEPDLVPLQSYIQDNDITKDPAAAEYVSLRCAAFYRVGVTAMDSETDPGIAPVKKSALERAETLMGMAIAIDVTRTGRSEKQSSTAMTAAASLIGRAYAARMKADKTERSNIGKDAIFTGDSDICRALPTPEQ